MIEDGVNPDLFVGRTEELRRLELTWRDVRLNRGRLAVVTGPAGVGKTRLADEGADRALRAGLKVVWGRCWPDGGAPALWPWQPVLAELCGPGTSALLESDTGLTSVDPERFSRFRAVSDRLAEACANSPTYLVIDDLHAADPGAVLLTRFLARSLHRLPLALVITRRPAGNTEALAELEREAIPIVLRHFDFEDTERFLAAQSQDLPEQALTRAIHRVTDGNPLFLHRLVALGASHRKGGLPDGLRDAIDRSLENLSKDAVRLLAVSAVLGTSVSVSEAAAMVRVHPVTVFDAFRAAGKVGLVTESSPGSMEFSHDLVRQALVAKLAPAERLDAHARAAEVIPADAGALRAHHAINAAARSPEDAERAVAACRTAAEGMVRRFGYEQAAALLATAAELCQGPEPSGLLLEWANAMLLSGRLAEARPLFDRAVTAARAEGVPELFAEAALGLGGFWVNEHREQVERQRVLGLQRKALAELPSGNATLRCRLEIRLAAEDVYSGGPLDPVRSGVAAARELGDDRTLAEALTLWHHAILRAEHTRERLDVAEELMAVASAAGLDILALQGLCWRTVDLFQLGDPRADRALAELRTHTDLLDCHSVRFIVAALDVMLLIRAGKLAEAEEGAERCFALGTRVGDADAAGWYGAHLLAIRWLQGRGAELVDLADEMANSPTLVEGEFTFRATVARFAAEAGQFDRARAALNRLTATGLANLQHTSTWLTGMLTVVEAAAMLGDAGVAAEAYELLRPFAELPIMPSLAVVCFGSTERPLGLAARTFGDLDAAAGHYRRAIAANTRLRNRPLTACCEAELAEVLVRRGGQDDLPVAAKLLESAIGEARALGLEKRAAAWTSVLNGIRGTGRSMTLDRVSHGWLLRWREREVYVEDLLGMRYLARLLANPGVPIRAVDLAHGGDPGAEPGNQDVLDARARSAYRARARELAEEIAHAREDGDLARTERLGLELDALTTELGHATGLGGRSRMFTGPGERARTAVRKAIKRAVDVVAAADSEVGEMLRAGISTGYECCYLPKTRER